MDWWYEYRLVWSARPWLALMFALAVLCVVAGIVGTATAAGTLAILFVPGLALLYGHHLLVTRRYS